MRPWRVGCYAVEVELEDKGTNTQDLSPQTKEGGEQGHAEHRASNPHGQCLLGHGPLTPPWGSVGWQW